ncbi:PREDICTED: ral guanine nucleotide dissociation stimulator-like 1 isoform X1 [Amphimedon queenslandica]|uniref:Ras-GEF domain-containing protein n=1 Tax=Amphimedon queenslandica TaxID=400682 RepID=A0AAN0JFK0_AMPQE|nr:PREDICTED: ral guanine nucleotide dissociation stimulator-like 1 isoform X1 [Amphimedon queenslandica]|eukprot:XP_019855418.1 PREDICTED: ral guanine nucleotide dissociation stimulator-like 1 isoform X1 [Amphimedon queenslandica]
MMSLFLQPLGEVSENGVIYSLSLRKVHCDVDETQDNRRLWTSQLERSIQYGPADALVDHLVPEDGNVDHSYRMCFLAVYRTFMTPTQLLQCLLDRLTSATAVKEEVCQDQPNAIKSIVSFIRVWLDKYVIDFHESNLFNDLQSFLEKKQDLTSQLPELLDLQRLVLSHYRKTPTSPRGVVTPAITEPGMCCHPRCNGTAKEYNWFSEPAQQVAQDLTALDAEIFRGIIPHQCLEYVRKNNTKSSSVYKAIDTFNKVVSHVLSTTLQARNSKGLRSPSSRGKCISHWIDIAQSCRMLKNFSSMKAIMSGLQSSSLFRLKRSWAGLSSDRRSVFKELDELISSESNFQTFRDVLDKEATGKGTHRRQTYEAVHGVVPYLGTLLTDLTMLHTALPDVNKDGLINFEKRRKEFEIIAKLTLFQASASKYLLPLNLSLVHWLYTSPTLSESESFMLSKELEVCSTTSPSPKSSPSSTPLHQTLLVKKSLHLLTIAVGDIPRLSKNDDDDDDSSSGDLKPLSISQRSNSCHEIHSTIIVKITIVTSLTCCNYKSILIEKTEHTDSVIRRALEKVTDTRRCCCLLCFGDYSQGSTSTLSKTKGLTLFIYIYYSLCVDIIIIIIIITTIMKM